MSASAVQPWLRRVGWSLAPRRRVFAAFYLYAFSFGGFFPRLAEIQRAMGVGEGALGLALIGIAAGTLVSLTFGAPWIARLGHRLTLLLLLPAVPAFYALASWAPSPLALFSCLFPAGLLVGMVEVVVNLEADRLEHSSGARLMNRSHAFWSMGFCSAAALGALMAYLGVSPHMHLALAVAVNAAGTVLLLGGFEAAGLRTGDRHLDPIATGQAASRFSAPTPAILMLVLVVSAAMVLEGAGFDWSAIYMRNVFASSPFVGGLAVASGAAAQALARYFADRFVQRYSPLGVARTLLFVLGLGCALVFAHISVVLSLLGFALMGVGTSAMFPLAMSAAARRTDRPSAVNVAALAQTAFVEFLLAPPLLGYVAQHLGIAWSFGIALPLVLLGLLFARCLQD